MPRLHRFKRLKVLSSNCATTFNSAAIPRIVLLVSIIGVLRAEPANDLSEHEWDGEGECGFSDFDQARFQRQCEIIEGLNNMGGVAGIPDTEGLCEVRESSVHGLGLFALQDIDAFTAVTMYPTHYLSHAKAKYDEWRMIAETHSHSSSPDQVGLKKLKEYTYDLNNLENIEHVTFEDGMIVGIAGDPSVLQDGFLAHMANDADRLTRDAEPKDVYRYMRNREKINVEPFHLGLYQIALMSKRRISKGEELFLDYGFAYWIGNEIQFRRLMHSECISGRTCQEMVMSYASSTTSFRSKYQKALADNIADIEEVTLTIQEEQADAEAEDSAPVRKQKPAKKKHKKRKAKRKQ